MSKIELDNITSGYNLGKINANFVKIEDALTNNVLFRDATGSTAGPNQMVQDIDMDNQSILNLPTPTAPTNPVRLQDLGNYATSTELTEVDNRLTAADVVLQNNIDTANSLRASGDNTLTSSVNALDGRVTTLETGTSGDSRYIHWLYNDGSATGGETTINIPYDFTSIATVFINGVRMSYGLAFEYDVTAKTVTFAEALDITDEVVVSLGTEPVQDYSDLVNDVQIAEIQDITKPYIFNNVSGMVNSTIVFPVGKTLETGGYYTKGDAGQAKYLIVAAQAADGYGDHTLANGTVAVLQVENNKVDIKHFGANGNGVYVNTLPLNAVLTYAATNSVDVLFSEGTYNVDSTLLLDSAINVKITASAATLHQVGIDETNTLHIKDSDTITVSGLIFRGTGVALPEATTGFAGQGIYVQDCTNIRITDNEIYNQASSGVLCYQCSNVWIDSNYLHDNLRLWDIALGYASPADNTPLENCWITNNRCYSPLGAWGIHIQGYGSKVTVTGNHTRGHNDYGILCYRRDDFGTRQWADVVISNNIVEDVSDSSFSTYFAGMGIYIQTVTNVSITGNIVRNVLQNRSDQSSPNRTLPPAAISINGATEVTCVGNVVEDSGIDGIDVVNVGTSTKGNTVANNSISNCYVNGVYVNATQKLTVTGNTIDGTAASLFGGITISSHATNPTNDIIISNNLITQGFYFGIAVSEGTGTSCNRVTIESNIIRDVSGDYISVVNSGQVVITNNSVHQTVIAHTVSRYGIICSSVDDVIISNNMVKGGTLQLYRGIAVVNSDQPLVCNNAIYGISDIFYALYMTGNTGQNLYGNLNPRQGAPMFGPHAVGNNPSSDTQYLISYGTTIPTVGSLGSIRWNLSPAAGGTVGWVCVAANTWKPFGAIDV